MKLTGRKAMIAAEKAAQSQNTAAIKNSTKQSTKAEKPKTSRTWAPYN